MLNKDERIKNIDVEQICCLLRIEAILKARNDLINNTKDYYPDILLKGREELAKQYGMIEPLFVDLVIGEADFLSKLRNGNGE